jgi:CRP-like cAMP-binding protein
MPGMDAKRIAGSGALAGLPAHELDELAGVMSSVEIDAGTEVMTHGNRGHLIYFVEQGQADVLTDTGEVARTLGPGDTFGEIAILVTGRRTATVVARTHLVLLALFESDFEAIRPRVPEFERVIRRVGSERLRALLRAEDTSGTGQATPPSTGEARDGA